MFCFVDLWSQWVDPETNEKFRAYVVMITKANNMVAEIHTKPRMSVILTKEEENIWLNKSLPVAEKMKILDTFPDELMVRTKVRKL